MIPVHGGQMRQIEERFGLDPRRMVDFSANINPEGPPESVVEALRRALEEPSVLAAYPDLEETELRRAIALHDGVRVEQVAVANGVIPLLEAALRALGVKRCLLPVPSFSEYRGTLERVDVEVTPHLLRAEEGFGYGGVLEALRQGAHDAVLLANPQNPSGVLTGKQAMLALVEEAGRTGVRVLLDEAFIDYAPEDSLVGEVGRLRNLTVFRSLTKFYSVPGLRVAYAVAEESLVLAMGRRIAAWSITTLASVGARAALADGGYAARTLELNTGRRERLAQGMKEIGVESSGSANFLLLRLPDGVDAARCWQRLIVEHGVVTRHCGNFEGLPGGYLRALVRGDEDNKQLLTALEALIRG